MQKKAFDKIQPFHVKNTQIRNRRQLSQNDKAIYEKPTINIIFMVSGPLTSWQIDGETVETVADFNFGGSKITAGGDCSHEIKRRLFLGRKVMTNLDSILRRRNITLPRKGLSSQIYGFLVVTHGCESCNIKKAEC